MRINSTLVEPTPAERDPPLVMSKAASFVVQRRLEPTNELRSVNHPMAFNGFPETLLSWMSRR